MAVVLLLFVIEAFLRAGLQMELELELLLVFVLALLAAGLLALFAALFISEPLSDSPFVSLLLLFVVMLELLELF